MNEKIKYALFRGSILLFWVIATPAAACFMFEALLWGWVMLLLDAGLLVFCLSQKQYKEYLRLNKKDALFGFCMGAVCFAILFIAFAFVSENETLGWAGIIVVVAVIGGFLYIRQNSCPRCRKIFSMKVISKQFMGTETVTRDVRVPEYKTYTIDGKFHKVTEYKTERQYADVKVYLCLERCENCGFERTVKRKEG